MPNVSTAVLDRVESIAKPIETAALIYIGAERPEWFIDFIDRNSFAIQYCKNHLEAFEFLVQRSGEELPDVILCSTVLQGADVFTFYKQIKAVPKLERLIFIGISGERNTRLLQQAFKVGFEDCYDYIPKPNALKRRLEYLIKRQRTAPVEAEVFQEFKLPFIKRAFDVLASGFALLLLSPLLLLLAALIRLESKGPVFYSSKRVGTGYKIFDFYKFRSMRVGADKELATLKHLNRYATDTEIDKLKSSFMQICDECLKKESPCSPILYMDGKAICEKQFKKQKQSENPTEFLKLDNDPRITKTGAFIRKVSLDELPQLVNVWKGDMSLVGNRPLPIYEAEKLTSDQWINRFMAPAGITGLWQTQKFVNGVRTTEDERKEMDNYYAENYSIWLDISIILKTLPALWQRDAS